ncbi:hypothetical protein Goshw_013628 [Gossypium schwendimanii]|uniref:Uncharacterized protein n=1 Tax=Gossypium schwendimanii TaxID=34291 RepID=A0A7J9N9R1_GOSSC|nr:hypothetical protein [Gossypium schwendimanii]
MGLGGCYGGYKGWIFREIGGENITSHLFLVPNEGDRRGFQGIRQFFQPALLPFLTGGGRG